VTNAFMQHPVGHAIGPDGALVFADVRAYLLNEWALIQFAHNQVAALVTGSFVVAAVGAFYALRGVHLDQGGCICVTRLASHWWPSILVAFPTGDSQAKIVARYQPQSLAAMEGRFESGPMAEITLIGQPNVRERRLDNPIRIPGMLSFLAFGTFHSDVPGLGAFPQDTWPRTSSCVLRVPCDGRSRHDVSSR
jgi:cytochrome d ubiquinol oxidase subunit I